MLADVEQAQQSQRFFKADKGGYGEGDQFLGIRVPILRKLVTLHASVALSDILAVLKSEFHEARLLALLLLVHRYQKSDTKQQQRIGKAYLKNVRFVNNWDLVDSSAHLILGPQLWGQDHSLLFKLAKSPSLWKRRIAVMTTFHFIKQGEFATTLALCERLLSDKADLMHKACGWMLREIGNRDRKVEQQFLDLHAANMPRTMLRYAIEKFPESLRQHYLQRK
jgi:3-methyladenine DNA glycosylase AlkD